MRRHAMRHGRLYHTVRAELLDRAEHRGSLPLTELHQWYYQFRREHRAPRLSSASFHATVHRVMREEGFSPADVMLRPSGRGRTYFLEEEPEELDEDTVERLEHDEPLAVLFVEKSDVARRLSYALRDSGVRTVSLGGMPSKAQRQLEERYRKRGVPTFGFYDYDAGGDRNERLLPKARRIHVGELEEALERRLPGRLVERDAWADSTGYPELLPSSEREMRELARRAKRVRFPARLEIGAIAAKVGHPELARGLLRVMGAQAEPDYGRLLSAVGVTAEEDEEVLRRLRSALDAHSRRRVSRAAAESLRGVPLEKFSLREARKQAAAKMRGSGLPVEAVKLLMRAAELIEAEAVRF